MTIAYLVEGLTGKKVTEGSRLHKYPVSSLMKKGGSTYSSFKGSMDATPFSGLTIESIQEELAHLGVNRCGDEVMFDGMTGEPLSCLVFMCPVYYQRLKHMVLDKVHCLSPDHEVLTTKGWKWIDEVTIDDRVATLQDEKVVYANPTEVHRGLYEGDMYSVATAHVNLLVTSNHRMWASVKENGEWSPFRHILASKLYFYREQKFMDIDGKELRVNGLEMSIVRDYSGRVYCLSVPGEVFYVRRRGCAVWTGNSRARGGRTTLMRGPTEGRNENGGLRIGVNIAPKSQRLNLWLVRMQRAT